jgi:cysteine desulfurase/selenocysteine lyase
MDRLGLPATARASIALYNTREDIDALVAALLIVRGMLG